MNENIFIYQWGSGIYILDDPKKEPLEAFILRHVKDLKTQDKEGVIEYMTHIRITQGVRRNFFVGTEIEWEEYKRKYAEIEERAIFGKEAVVDSIMFSTLIVYASLYKNGKITEIMTVLNQLARANLDLVNTITINQDYERVLHSMLIEMYTNHRELYTAMFYTARLQKVYETNIVKDFLVRVFQNNYLLEQIK